MLIIVDKRCFLQVCLQYQPESMGMAHIKVMLHPTNIIFPFYYQLFLIFREAAESMAEKVATWRDLYGIDGVDLDIEVRAGQLHG